MTPDKDSVLSINGGSSSIKFALYEVSESFVPSFHGKIENIGVENTSFQFENLNSNEKENSPISAENFTEAINFLLDFISEQAALHKLKAIGHRLVHGMKHTKPTIINNELLTELKQIIPFAPQHLPGEIQLIEAFQKRFPSLLHIACFDTSFHTTMPTVAKQLTLPRKFIDKGIQRYGFHGISYSYLMEEIEQVAGNETAQGKIILAHLGHGASLAAINESKCIDTSMGFTPTSGLMMATRTGDLDPGVSWYLMESEEMNAATFSNLINKESGLLGISETSSDLRTLLANEESDYRAAEAIELFCYQTRKWIGAFAAALGGLDTLIFSGGIGENAPEVRSRICHNFQFLGIDLDDSRNKKNEAIISTDASNVCVRVIKTNEEWMIAKSVCDVLNYSLKFK